MLMASFQFAEDLVLKNGLRGSVLCCFTSIYFLVRLYANVEHGRSPRADLTDFDTRSVDRLILIELEGWYFRK